VSFGSSRYREGEVTGNAEILAQREKNTAPPLKRFPFLPCKTDSTKRLRIFVEILIHILGIRV
jgi:hypothetical protein